MSRLPSILIVDDEAGIRSAAANAFRNRGHECFEAENLDEAIALAKQNAIEILLTDLRLHGGDGIRVIEGVKQILPSIRPIVMTGYGTLEDAVQALRLGAVDFLTKPFKIEALFRIVDRVGVETKTRPAATPSFSLPYRASFPATAKGEEAFLLAVSSLLRNLPLEKEVRSKTLSLFSEAVRNAIRHAYQEKEGSFHATLHQENGFLSGSVSDEGKGFDASEKTAAILTNKIGPLSGISCMQKTADDFKIQSQAGKGCRMEFKVELQNIRPPGWLAVPAVPVGEAWTALIEGIEGSQTDLRIDCTELEFLTVEAGRQLQKAIRSLGEKGIRAEIQNFRLPFPAADLLFETNHNATGLEKDSRLIRQALWA